MNAIRTPADDARSVVPPCGWPQREGGSFLEDLPWLGLLPRDLPRDCLSSQNGSSMFGCADGKEARPRRRGDQERPVSHPCEASMRRKREPDCLTLSHHQRPPGRSDRCEMSLLARPAIGGSIRIGFPPDARVRCEAPQRCSCGLRGVFRTQFQQGKKLRHFNQSFRLTPFRSGQRRACILAVQQRSQTALHPRRQFEAGDPGRHGKLEGDTCFHENGIGYHPAETKREVFRGRKTSNIER